MKKKLIIDCDNTFGVAGCDLDDGLAILYALGADQADLLAVTTTFGNNTLDVVYPNTIRFMTEIKKSDIPIYRGHEEDAQENAASRYMIDMANAYCGKLHIVSTGSLTNLYHAYLLDPAFFEKIESISLMGGITEDLIIGGKKLDELNFSCNHEAAYAVLTNGKNISIATGNHCLDALFTRSRFDQLKNSEHTFERWLWTQAQYWFEREKNAFGHDGIYKWDVYAAAMLLAPSLFDQNATVITPDQDSLKTGNLIGKGSEKNVFLPKLNDTTRYIESVYDAYRQFGKSILDETFHTI